MQLVSVSKLFELYGGWIEETPVSASRRPLIEPFQILEKRGDLVEWEDIKDDDETTIATAATISKS